MGVIVDGIIGPVLESLGIIEINESGEWLKRERKPRTKKERHWFEWFSGLVRRIKKFWEDKFLTRSEKRYKEKTETIQPQEIQPHSKRNRYRLKSLKEITKFEGRVLISSGNYKVWYGDFMPEDDEIQEGVVYIVKGRGSLVSNAPVLHGIRYDGYYVWDKEKDTEQDKTQEEHDALREEAKRRWDAFGINVIDPGNTFTITPNLE